MSTHLWCLAPNLICGSVDSVLVPHYCWKAEQEIVASGQKRATVSSRSKNPICFEWEVIFSDNFYTFKDRPTLSSEVVNAIYVIVKVVGSYYSRWKTTIPWIL